MSYRFLASYLENGALINLLYLLDQVIIFVFLLIRRPTIVISRRPLDWLYAFGGSYLPLLVAPANLEAGLIPPGVAAVLMLLGILVHLMAKLSLRRSFGVVAANRGVKSDGLYRFVRHPMYTGYFIVQVSFLLVGPTVWNLGVFALAWVLQVCRIQAEERLLLSDPAYASFAATTRSRLIPGVY